MAPMAQKLDDEIPALETWKVLPLAEVLDTTSGASPYPSTVSYDDIKNDHCLILHSSGSTGDPKLVYMTHGTFSVTDNDTYMPVPEGRRAQNAAQFNFEDSGRFYSCFPPYHMAGVQAYIILPTFSKTATVVMGPAMTPPSGFLLSEIMKQQHLRGFYVPPFIIQQWVAEPEALEQAKGLKFVLYGGGPLSSNVGNALSKVTDVCQMYGSLELGQVQMLIPLPGQWEYLEPNPYEECDMQHIEDGLYEMVLHHDAKFHSHRSVSHNFPDVKTWRTGDLFTRHPSNPSLLRFHSRIDDMIVLSSSHKLRPLEMETLIQGDPLVAGALIVGTGRPEPLLIIEPRSHEILANDLIDRIWPAVCEANSIAPSYGVISRSRIIVARPGAPFIRAPKGTIVRRSTEALYRDGIDQAYSEEESKDNHNGTLQIISTEMVKEYIRSTLGKICPNVKLDDSDNIFAMGVDSLRVVELCRKLKSGLSRRVHANVPDISLRMVYTNPSINELANAIMSSTTQPCKQQPASEYPAIGAMQNIVEEFASSLPPPKGIPEKKLSIVLIGPRGRLGPNIVKFLLQSSHVGSVHCLNRGENGRERLRCLISETGPKFDVDDPRLHFYNSKVGESNFGLSPEDTVVALDGADVIIHNSWKVNFGWTLDSYKDELIRSVRVLVDVSARAKQSPRVVFISSTSSVQDWGRIFPGVPVTEEPAPSWDVASPLGYGQSKHVAERILTIASKKLNIPVTILRLGQVAGPTTSTIAGSWPIDEWLPTLAMISKSISLIPNDLPAIDWIPVDTMAEIICEISLNQIPLAPQLQSHIKRPWKSQQSEQLLQVFNIVNPNLTPFADFVETLQGRLGPAVKQAGLIEWIQILSAALKTMSERDADISLKNLPFFQLLAETITAGYAFQPKFNTDKACSASMAMSQKLGGVDKKMIALWCEQWGL
ncbi:uncharacterized protein GIQ15_06287 [Arthroderma uncinatum]|uniref:uncharacterized protein n=1 Tax=Arthroderma uncinatum TaxID=74035 RepID=UPI00144A65E0|nr:uncharacterized protein GIQ15_06287 [Arthroderma uncinatum]KAF3480940.1 hypothetical protein GIQ15_06287 [Arthroderma uncinatum]